MNRLLPLLLMASATALSGCDYLGIEPATKAAEQKVAEGKAIGGACRHANRALEDCYRYNPKAHKASIFDGWKDMDVYMRENKLDTIEPVTPPEPPKKTPPPPAATEEAATESADKATDKGEEKKPAASAKH